MEFILSVVEGSLHSLHSLPLHYTYIHFSTCKQRTATAFHHSISQAMLCFSCLAFANSLYTLALVAIAKLPKPQTLICQMLKSLQALSLCLFHSVRHLPLQTLQSLQCFIFYCNLFTLQTLLQFHLLLFILLNASSTSLVISSLVFILFLVSHSSISVFLK